MFMSKSPHQDGDMFEKTISTSGYYIYMYTIISMLQSKIMAPTSDLDCMGIFSNRIQLGELNSYPHPVFRCLHFCSSAPLYRFWVITRIVDIIVDMILYRFISIYSWNMIIISNVIYCNPLDSLRCASS